MLVAVVALRALVVLAPAQLPQLDTVQLSGAPFGAAAGIAGFAVLLFGVLPSLFAARTNLASPLRLDSRSGVETRHRRTIRQILVASQVALAMVMLGGAALLARSLERLQTQSLGFVSDHLSVVSFTYNAMKTDSVSKLIALGEQLLPKVRALPGVTSVTPILVPPLVGEASWHQRFDREGQTAEEATYNSPVPIEAAGPDYFKTFGIPVVKGRAFLDSDRENAPLVAIVSETVARRFWGSEDPIGKRIRNPFDGLIGGTGWRTVVGVAPDTHLRSLKEAIPTVYLPWHQSYWQPFIAIRSTSLASLLPAIRQAAEETDSQLQLWHGQTMDQLLDQPLAQPRFSTMLMSAFGLVALVLAAIGLYGVMSSVVRDQTREIGIRLALGATSADVRADVMRKAAIMIGSGVAVGLAVAFAGSQLLATMLFQVRPTDPVALLGATVVLICAGALAAYLPARRATRIDPVEALRAD
jgi:predicted permease